MNEKYVEICANPKNDILDVAIFRLNRNTGAYSPNRYKIKRSSYGARNLGRHLYKARFQDSKIGLYGNSFYYYF